MKLAQVAYDGNTFALIRN